MDARSLRTNREGGDMGVNAQLAIICLQLGIAIICLQLGIICIMLALLGVQLRRIHEAIEDRDQIRERRR